MIRVMLAMMKLVFFVLTRFVILHVHLYAVRFMYTILDFIGELQLCPVTHIYTRMGTYTISYNLLWMCSVVVSVTTGGINVQIKSTFRLLRLAPLI